MAPMRGAMSMQHGTVVGPGGQQWRSDMRSSTRLSVLALAISCLSLTAAAQTQNQSPPASAPSTQAPAPSGSSASIPDNKIDAAAAAVKSVTAVRQDYEQRIVQASEADKKRIAVEGNQALTKAITDQGLSIEEYTTILKVAQNDPVVREKMIERLK
jgi:uncharacterized protein DUF4168